MMKQDAFHSLSALMKPVEPLSELITFSLHCVYTAIYMLLVTIKDIEGDTGGCSTIYSFTISVAIDNLETVQDMPHIT